MVSRLSHRIPVYLLLSLLLLGGCGGGGESGAPIAGAPPEVAGSIQSLLRWNEYDPEFPMPEREAWSKSTSGLLANTTPHHNGYDLFLQLGHTAPLQGKFHYGDLRVDLTGEKVALFLRKAGEGSWRFLGDEWTDDDGRVSLAFPADFIDGPGTYFVKFVVYGDLSTADALVRIVEGTVPSVVMDIDGTLTISDGELQSEIWNDLLFKTYVPRMYDHANQVALALAKQGYEIFYLTARPYWLTRASRAWLRLKGFPLGTVTAYPGAIPTFGAATANYKAEALGVRQAEGADFQHAFGNSETDIQAYASAGIPTAQTYLIGENAGVGGTVALAKYADLFGALVPVPAPSYRVVLLVVDGLRPDAFRLYLEQAGEESAFKALFGTSLDVTGSVTTAPSLTFSAHASIATGRNPGKHGVVANNYFDRKSAEVRAFSGGPTAQVGQVVASYRGQGLANRSLQCQTLFEQMSSSGRYGTVAGYMYYKGAEYLEPSILQLATYLIDTRSYDRSITDKALERLDGVDTPDLLTIYWPGMDHETHAEGGIGWIDLSPADGTNAQLKYLDEVLDPELARLRDRLAELGVLDQTVFVLCSDHGFSNVPDDDAHVISIDPFGLDNEVAEILEDSPYDDLYDSIAFEGDFDCHAALNEGMLSVTLRNRATLSWQDSPRYLEDVLPVVGAIQRHRWKGQLNVGGVDAVEEILVRESLESPYRVYRPTRVRITFDEIQVVNDGDSGDPGEVTYRLGANGRTLATIGELSANSGDVLPVGQAFEIDLLPGMALTVEARGEEDDFWFFDDDLGSVSVTFPDKASVNPAPLTASSSTGDFKVTFHLEIVPLATYVNPELPQWGNSCPLTVLSSEYAQGAQRIESMRHPNRSGDILVLPSFRQGFYFGQKEKATHGSLYPEDSIHSFFVGGIPVTQSKVVAGGAIVDITATVAHILGIDLRQKEGGSFASPDLLPLLPPAPGD